MIILGSVDFGRGLEYEGRALIIGSVPLKEESRELAHSLSFMSGYRRNQHLQPRRGLSPEPHHAGTLILDF